jgi:hypothetical protein
MYKLTNTNNVIRQSDVAWIPINGDNTDYQQFKKDIANGVALQDATGTAITDITTFLGTLP